MHTTVCRLGYNCVLDCNPILHWSGEANGPTPYLAQYTGGDRGGTSLPDVLLRSSPAK